MKIFTVQEANALLPNVKVIVGEIQRAHRRLSTYSDEAKKAAEAAEHGGGGLRDGVAYAMILTELTTQLAELDTESFQLSELRGQVRQNCCVGDAVS